MDFEFAIFSNFVLQLMVEVLFLATASISGLYYRIMSDAAHNRTVDGTRTGIQQRVKLECEREQQEQLLLSVIPAYIAAEVSEMPFDFFFLIRFTKHFNVIIIIIKNWNKYFLYLLFVLARDKLTFNFDPLFLFQFVWIQNLNACPYKYLN